MTATTDPTKAFKAFLRKRGLALTDEDVSEIESLIDRGADPNLRTGDCPAITRLIDRGYPARALEILLARGADPNAIPGKRCYYILGRGETPLARAACSPVWGRIDSWIQVLLRGGADAGLRDSRGNTVVDHLMEGLREHLALCWWDEQKMEKPAIAGTIRYFFNEAQPLLRMLRMFRSRGVAPGTLTQAALESRLNALQEHQELSLKWLEQYERGRQAAASSVRER